MKSAARVDVLAWYKAEWERAEEEVVRGKVAEIQRARRWQDKEYCDSLGAAASDVACNVVARNAEDWALESAKLHANQLLGEFWSLPKHLLILKRLTLNHVVPHIDMSHSGLDDELLEVLITHMRKNGQTNSICLSHTAITDAGVDAVCSLLGETALEVIDVANCTFLTEASVQRFTDAAHEHLQLRHVVCTEAKGVEAKKGLALLRRTAMLNMMAARRNEEN